MTSEKLSEISFGKKRGSFCDFCIVAEENPLADKYEKMRDEYGFIISKKKERK